MRLLQIAVRIIMGTTFLCIGIIHFLKSSYMAVYVPFPWGAEEFVQLSGSIIVIVSIAIILNKFVRTCLVLLSLVLVITALLVEIPIMLREPEYILRLIGLSNLIKLGLASMLLLTALNYNSKI